MPCRARHTFLNPVVTYKRLQQRHHLEKALLKSVSYGFNHRFSFLERVSGFKCYESPTRINACCISTCGSASKHRWRQKPWNVDGSSPSSSRLVLKIFVLVRAHNNATKWEQIACVSLKFGFRNYRPLFHKPGPEINMKWNVLTDGNGCCLKNLQSALSAGLSPLNLKNSTRYIDNVA